MSCEDCEKMQEAVFEHLENGTKPLVAYLRVGNADVAIVGCKEHVSRVAYVYRVIGRRTAR